MTLTQVRALLARECERSGSQAAWARAHDVTRQHIYDVLHGERDPGPKILDALGLEKAETTYRRKVK